MSNPVQKILEKYFDTNTFVIENQYNEFNISTIDNNPCLRIYIRPDHILISNLDKCNSSGTELLNLIEKVSEQIDTIKYITLIDVSTIQTECTYTIINLEYLKILTTGQSWYNSKGYISNNFEIEYAHNTTIIQLPFISAISVTQQRIHDFKINAYAQMTKWISYRDKFEKKHSLNIERINTLNGKIADYPSYIEEHLKRIESTEQIILTDANKLFPTIDINLPVNEYLIKILNTMNNRFDQSDELSCLKYSFVQKIIEWLKPSLKYSIILTKTVNHRGGGAKRRNRRSRKLKRKIGSTRKH